MPELPEVETIRRQLAPEVEGCSIASLAVCDAKLVSPSPPETFERALNGQTIARLRRRGKYFVFELATGQALLLHLRMTGNLLYTPTEDQAPLRHERARFSLVASNGDAHGTLVFADPRRFGTAEILASSDMVEQYFAQRLGPEPFSDEFDGKLLHQRSRARRTPVKALLLDQRVVAGVGNIYADEALHRAGIAPGLRASRLTRKQCDALADAIRLALKAGIDAKGASIDDFRDAYGVQGSFQDQFLVHRREGDSCAECGATIVKTRVAGRGTYHCPTCQPN